VRYGVIADIHGNLPALQAALRALRRLGVDRYACAGDLVGYGPFPNECVETVAALDPLCVAGNHDLIAIGRLTDANCIALARESLRWTRRVLRDDVRAYLESLPLRVDAESLVLAHGSLEDPEEYTTGPEQADRQLAAVAQTRPDARALVLGHTHRSWAYTQRAGPIAARRSVRLGDDGPLLLNPGAVGQAREVRVRARFLVVDLECGEAEFRSVPYDVAACRGGLRRAGLPERSYHLPPKPLMQSLQRGRRIARLALAKGSRSRTIA